MIEKFLEIFLSHLAIERGLSKNTLAAYQTDLLALDKFLKTENLLLDGESIKKFLISNNNAPATKDRQLSCLKTFFRYLQDEGILTEDPTQGMHSKNKVFRLPKSLTIEQVNKLIEMMPNSTPIHFRDRLLVELLYGTGIRISEAVSLDLEDIDFENKWIKIKFGKGAKQRLVPLGSALEESLRQYLVQARAALLKHRLRQNALLVSHRGSRLTRQAAWSIIKLAGSKSDLPVDLSPHALRHTFATHLLAGGADIRVVQELLGHSSVTTTQIYTKVNIDQIRDTFLLAHPRAR